MEVIRSTQMLNHPGYTHTLVLLTRSSMLKIYAFLKTIFLLYCKLYYIDIPHLSTNVGLDDNEVKYYDTTTGQQTMFFAHNARCQCLKVYLHGLFILFISLLFLHQ